MRAGMNRVSGFTLMELLAAITLMVVLGTMLFTVFKSSSDVIRDASGRQLVFQQAKLFMDHIEREASGAYWSKQGRAAGMRPFLIADSGRSIAMVTAAKVRDTRPDSPNFGTEANMGRIGYFLRDNTLYRYEYYTLYGSGDEATEVSEATPFLTNVVNFTVECFDNGRFTVRDWNSSAGSLPKAIRITLRITDDRHLSQYLNPDNDRDHNGHISRDEAEDDVVQTFQHVAYLGARTW